MCQELIMEGISVHFANQKSLMIDLSSIWLEWFDQITSNAEAAKCKSNKLVQHKNTELSGYAYSIGYGSMRYVSRDTLA